MSIIINGDTGVSGVDGSAATPSYQGTDTNTGIFYPAADTIAFAEGGTEVMRIDSSGNVGIGTSSPSAKLQIGDGSGTNNAQTLRFFSGYPTGNTGETGTILYSSNIAGGNYQYVGAIKGYMQYASNTNALGFYVGSWNNSSTLPASPQVVIDGNGNVGIGTSSPAQKLHVAGGTINWVRVDDTTNSCFTLVGSTAGNGVIGTYSAHPLLLVSNSLERMRIDSSGNVGIGTTSPSQKLNVGGTVHITGAGTFPTTSEGIEIVPAAAGGDNYIQAYSRAASSWQKLFINSLQTAFGTNGTERMRIDSNGNFTAVIPSGSTSYPAFWCRAWVNFNGTGTPAIRASGNVTSITDNGVADFTVNFGTAMPDVNFCANITATGPVATQHCVPFIGSPGSNDTSGFPNTSSFRFSQYNLTNSASRADAVVLCVSIFR